MVFGTDNGPIPYGIEEHVQIVEDVLPSPAERELVFWKTSNKVFGLGLVDTTIGSSIEELGFQRWQLGRGDIGNETPQRWLSLRRSCEAPCPFDNRN